MPDLIDQFAEGYCTLNSIGDARRHQMVVNLRRYQAALDDKPIEQADDRDLRAYLVMLLGECELQASTVAWHLKSIKPLYGWMYQERMIDADLLLRIRGVSAPRGGRGGAPRPYNRRELTRLGQALDAKFPYYTGDYLTNRYARSTVRMTPILRRHATRLMYDAIIELALGCGLRRIEIYHLSLDDLHADNEYIVVHGKRQDQHDKMRDIPYHDETRARIGAWLKFRKLMKPRHKSVWLSLLGDNAARYNTPMSIWTLSRMMGVLGDFELHRLRHTFATNQLRAGTAIQDLQYLMGHSQIEMTMRYARVVGGDVRRNAQGTNPAFRRAIDFAA